MQPKIEVLVIKTPINHNTIAKNMHIYKSEDLKEKGLYGGKSMGTGIKYAPVLIH